MEAVRRILVLLGCCLALQACGPGAYRWEQPELPASRTYEVKRGDTLYSIAWRYGLDYREVARWNGIGADYLIHPGQVLHLAPRANVDAVSASPPANEPPRERIVMEASTPPVTATAAASAAPMPPLRAGAWQWPAKGAVLAKFGQAVTGKGITIGGSVGDDVVAAADGRVVYAGSGLIGYGKIIILKHSEEFLSAYGHNDSIHVREGEQVRRGDRIASMGRGPGNTPLLHFEIRVNGEAVDPMKYLPSR